MQPSDTAPKIFLTRSYSFRTARNLRRCLTSLAISVGATCWAVPALWRDFARQGVAQAGNIDVTGPLALVIAICALAIGIAVGWAYVTRQVDEIVVSEWGVRCGSESWPRESIAAIRARRLRPDQGIQLFIWPRRDRGAGRCLFVDEPLTDEEARRLMAQLLASWRKPPECFESP